MKFVGVNLKGFQFLINLDPIHLVGNILKKLASFMCCRPDLQKFDNDPELDDDGRLSLLDLSMSSRNKKLPPCK